MKNNKFKDVKIFDSTFYCRNTIRIVFLLILIWISMGIFFNWNSILNNVSFNNLLFVTQDSNTIRYVLSSAFQGLSALFALVVSISYIAAQLASSYTPRLIIRIAKSKIFTAGVIVFVISISYNLLLLTFVSDDYVKLAGFNYWLIISIILDLVSLVYIIPYTFYFLKTINPWNVNNELVDRFNEKYFTAMTKKKEVDESLPLLQTVVVKGIDNGDVDLVSGTLRSLFNRLGNFINDENYYFITSYFQPFFYKLIRKATEKKESDILQQLIFHFEGLQNKIISSDFMKTSKFRDEYYSSLPHMILFLMNESIKFGDGEMLGVGFGAISRLGKRIIPLMPADDNISEIRSMKEMRKKNYAYTNSQEEYDNHNIFEYIMNVFVIEENIKLADSAIKLKNEESASKILRQIVHIRHDFLNLDNARQEAKQQILSSTPYHIKKLMKSASDYNVDITSTIITGVQESIDQFIVLDNRTAEYYVSLMCDALRLMIEKEYFSAYPEATFNMAGTVGRIITSRHKESKKMLQEIILTMQEIVGVVDRRSKTSTISEYEKIKNEIAVQLKSFQRSGLKDVDESMNTNLDNFLAINFDKKFLESIDKK